MFINIGQKWPSGNAVGFIDIRGAWATSKRQVIWWGLDFPEWVRTATGIVKWCLIGAKKPFADSDNAERPQPVNIALLTILPILLIKFLLYDCHWRMAPPAAEALHHFTLFFSVYFPANIHSGTEFVLSPLHVISLALYVLLYNNL